MFGTDKLGDSSSCRTEGDARDQTPGGKAHAQGPRRGPRRAPHTRETGGGGGGGRPRSRSRVGSGVAEGCRAVLSPPRSEGAAFREEAREAVGLGDESVDVTSG